MRGWALRHRSAGRHIVLGFLAVAVLALPGGVFSIVTEDSAQRSILRLHALIGVSLLAVLPWAANAGDDVRRRLRRWSVPGVAASVVYLVFTEPLFLMLGFCLLAGASLDTWVTRAHVASESLRARLTSGDRQRHT